MLAVSNKVNGEVYLEGSLERGVVPEECVWEYGGGSGQDGCILYLQKMNLELLRRSTPLSVALVSLPALPVFLPHSALALPCLLNGPVVPCPADAFLRHVMVCAYICTSVSLALLYRTIEQFTMQKMHA